MSLLLKIDYTNGKYWSYNLLVDQNKFYKLVDCQIIAHEEQDTNN